MFRLAMLALPFLALPVFAQSTDAPDLSGLDELVPIDCTDAGEGIACTVETEGQVTFCMAVDAEGEPLANSTGATDAGEVLFQNVAPARIAGLRCR